MGGKLRLISFALILAAATSSLGADKPPAGPANASPAAPPLYDNLGSWHHKITTDNPLTQKYFDQGLRLVYGFNHPEAIDAFQQAARLDPNCAMCYWGEALALGPNINIDVDPTREKSAYEAVQKAKSLENHASDEEHAYIDALTNRYSIAPKADLKQLQRNYADAMRKVAQRYPDDADAKTLFAESLMDLSPWNNWTRDGKPLPGTLEIVATLEEVLKKEPNHPGANHYYIHAVEASQHPERALPSADRLGKLEPGAGHLVHMPAHIYIRTGRYSDSVDVNQQAVKVDEGYIAQRHPETVYPMLYYPHNIHFIYASACYAGRRADALEAARKVASIASPDAVRQMPVMEFAVPSPLFAMVRFGMWDDVLKEPAPAPDLKYSNGMWHYARGRAFAAKGEIAQARKEQKALDAIAAALPPKTMFLQNTANDILAVAQVVLAGDILAKEHNYDQAIAKFRKGVELEEALKYQEPPDWYYPVRQSLGAALLEAGKPGEAEAVFRADLKINPDNGWSLYGLEQALRAQHKDAEAAKVAARFKIAWAKADVQLNSAVF